MALRNFGNQAIGGQAVYFPPANSKAVCRFQNTSGAALLVTNFYGQWANGSGNGKVRAVIYSDVGGNPGSLLATSNELNTFFTRWHKLTFPTPLLIPANGYVWFGVIGDVAQLSVSSIASGDLRYNANTYTDGPSATFGAATALAYSYRMFLEGDDGTTSFGRRSIDITGIASGDGNYQADREHIEKAVLGGTSSVSVTSISTYIRNTSATVKSKAAIYIDNAGYPGTKLAQSAEVTGATANDWLTLTIPGGVVLSPGTYWLAFIASENLQTPLIPYSGALIVDGPITEASAWPASYPVGDPIVLDPTTDGRGIDIYASYSAAAPAAPARPQVFVCT